MDKKVKGRAFIDGIKLSLKKETEKRRNSKMLILVDIAAFLVALFFARRHIAFGAYPLAIALIAVLPSHVFIALPGALIGSLSLGSDGVILAVSVCAVVIFRLVCSVAVGDGAAPFHEGGAMRIGSAALGAAIGAVYEMILGSFSPSSMIFASAEVLLSVGLALVLLGVFSYDMDIPRLFLSGEVFTIRREGRERVSFLVYIISLLSFIFLISISLSGYDLFGISLAYLFVGALTLFVARRFGAVRAMAVGFFSAVGLDPVGAVGFALAGLVSGLLFDIGMVYGIVGGSAAISAWCAYSGGMTLFLSAIPEWSIASVMMIPYLRGASKERGEGGECEAAVDNDAIINERILRLRAERGREDAVERSLSMAAAARDYFLSQRGDIEEYRNAVIAATSGLNPPPCDEKIDALASFLFSCRTVGELDIQRILGIGYGAGQILNSLNASLFDYRRMVRERGGKVVCDSMEIQASLIRSSEARWQESLAENDALAREINSKIRMLGITDSSCRVLGGRRRRVYLATSSSADRVRDGSVARAIEGVLGAKVTSGEIHTAAGGTLFEVAELARLGFEVGCASSPSRVGVPSGDNACFFERDGILYAVLADGMGTGDVAMQSSQLVCDYLREGLSGIEDIETLLSSVNGILSAAGAECCVAVDVFFLDLYTGEGGFVKAGATPSFIKKGASVRRIRAKTNPIGAMDGVMCERCVTELAAGDVVIMFSDGVCEIPEQTLWLLDAVSRNDFNGATDMAEGILALAKKNDRSGDDMSVMVIEIKKG